MLLFVGIPLCFPRRHFSKNTYITAHYITLPQSSLPLSSPPFPTLHLFYHLTLNHVDLFSMPLRIVNSGQCGLYIIVIVAANIAPIKVQQLPHASFLSVQLDSDISRIVFPYLSVFSRPSSRPSHKPTPLPTTVEPSYAPSLLPTLKPSALPTSQPTR